MGSDKRNDKELDKEEKKNAHAVPLRLMAYSQWAGRFTWTAIIQGAIVALLTAMLAAFVATTGYPILLVQAMLSTLK